MFLWALALCFSSSFPVSAQKEITAAQNNAYLNFPAGILFSVQIESSAPVDQVRLIYSTNAHSCISSSAQVDVPILKKPSITAEWTWPLSILPPGAVVTWVWQIKDATGASITTPEQKLVVEDPHYTWQKLQSGKITLLWSAGSSSFGQQVLNTASTSLSRLEKSLGITEPNPVRLIIYPNSDELRAAIPNVPDWTGGIALPEYDAIMAGIDPDEPAYINEIIPHELAHLVVDQRIDNCVGSQLPTWLSEGLAVYAEGPTSKEDLDLVTSALQRGDSLDLRDLTSIFPANSEKARLAYAQSGMVAAYLVSTFGPTKLDELLEQVKQGISINPALQAVYALDTVGLEQAWRFSMGHGAVTPRGTPGTPTPKAQRTLVPTIDLFSTPMRSATPASTQTPEPTRIFTATAFPTAMPGSATPPPAISSPVPTAPAGLPIWIWFFAGAVCLLAVVVILLLKTRGGTPT